MAEDVKALFYDVFGTLMDWRTSIARESRAVLEPLGHTLDWLAFADAWRGQYQPSMEKVRSGGKAFVKLDILHRMNLETVMPQFGIAPLPEETMHHLTMAWHRLDAWPDVSTGQRRLRKKFYLAPCSNGNIALMADLARRNDIWWDAILGSEIAGDFKPKLNLRPEQCMMVAAHSRDLKAAAALGLRTGHIARVNEYGPNTGEPGPTVPVDYAARDLQHLADQLGC
ncbi:MAG: haloacid dehalogenase type II [Rhizobiales bacterium]|nr:haloacid dehalogenase type II [Hyphomicrobiales bacterium]